MRLEKQKARNRFFLQQGIRRSNTKYGITLKVGYNLHFYYY